MSSRISGASRILTHDHCPLVLRSPMPSFPRFRCIFLVLAVAAAGVSLRSQEAPRAVHTFFRVQAPPAEGPVSGRLLIFVKAGSGDNEVSTSEMHPSADTWVCAHEVHDIAPGSTLEVDADEI